MLKIKRPTRLFSAPMMSLLSIVILTPQLKSCDATNFRYVCPALKKYDGAFQDRLAAEYPSLPPASKQIITDYGQLRDACRALGSKHEP